METPSSPSTTIATRRDQVIKDLSRCNNWEDRYLAIISRGRKLAPMKPEHKVDSFLVRGCQSRTWLYPEFRDGRLFFEADSEASITKGIISLLVEVYSGATPNEILETSPDFLKQVGVTQHLSMNRSNGLASMAAMIRIYALGFSQRK